jgi:hypothetical protein
MYRLAVILAMTLMLFGFGATAQTAGNKDTITEKMMKDAAEKGFKLSTDLTVHSNVSVEAVLLPPTVTRGVFGKAVSDRYAAVQLIVSNHSRDAALVVHSIFIDYSQWLFSGVSNRPIPYCTPPTPVSQPHPAAAPSAPTLPECMNPPETWQADSKASQIAAAEYRIPRGQLLDNQQWSARNLAVRSLETVGSLAAGYVFAFREPGIAKGVAAFNGNFLPAFRSLFPDSAIDQANRISDLGYRVNKVVPKDSAEIMVAFFPIDRFLTPGIKKLFQKSPALFFVPQAALFDPQAGQLLKDAIQSLGTTDAKLRQELLAALQDHTPNKTLQLLDSLSLNRIRLVVGGVMTVDVDTVPASIESIDFDESAGAMLWSETGQKKGTIHGRYLSNGNLTILEADQLKITDVAAIADGSNDEALRFQITLTNSVAPGSKLTFRVDKKDNNQKPVEGSKFEYVVKDFSLTTPVIDKVERSGDNLTITGKSFFSTGANPLAVTLVPGSVAGVDEKAVKTVDRKPTELKIDLAALSLQPACWTPRVTVGTVAALGATAFAQPPVPKIASAKTSGTRVVLAGVQFIDLKSCGKPLAFEIAEQSAGSPFKPVEHLTGVSVQEVSFDLPKVPPDGKFKVRVLVGGVEADTRNIQ